MTTTITPTPTRQQRYRDRLVDADRVAMQVTVSNETANKLKNLAAEHDVSPGCALEQVLSVAAPVLMSPRKHARLERRVDEALEVIMAGERNVGVGAPIRKRRSGEAQ